MQVHPAPRMTPKPLLPGPEESSASRPPQRPAGDHGRHGKHGGHGRQGQNDLLIASNTMGLFVIDRLQIDNGSPEDPRRGPIGEPKDPAGSPRSPAPSQQQERRSDEGHPTKKRTCDDRDPQSSQPNPQRATLILPAKTSGLSSSPTSQSPIATPATRSMTTPTLSRSARGFRIGLGIIAVRPVHSASESDVISASRYRTSGPKLETPRNRPDQAIAELSRSSITRDALRTDGEPRSSLPR